MIPCPPSHWSGQLLKGATALNRPLANSKGGQRLIRISKRAGVGRCSERKKSVRFPSLCLLIDRRFPARCLDFISPARMIGNT